MIKVIDVSSYQGVIDWKKVKADGVTGAILKIIRKDLGKDKQFENNYKGVIAQKMPWGVYNYSYANTVAKAKSDANLVCDILDKCDPSNLFYGVWFDFEDRGTFAKMSKADCTKIAKAFCDTVESRGYNAGVYCNKEYFYKLNDFGNKDWWGARYPSSAQIRTSNNPKEQYKPTFAELFGWQYSSKCRVAGVPGDCDISVQYRDMYPIDGIANNFPMNKPEPTPIATPTVKNGTRGANAKLLQQNLNAFGYKLAEDGIFGAKSVSALKAWQKKNGLVSDGIYGKNSAAKMAELLK